MLKHTDLQDMGGYCQIKSLKKIQLEKIWLLKFITGKVNGRIFAKVVYGSGGHQDNVFAEAHEFGELVCKHGEPNNFYVILIDTDLTSQVKELRVKFRGRVLVVNQCINCKE